MMIVNYTESQRRGEFIRKGPLIKLFYSLLTRNDFKMILKDILRLIYKKNSVTLWLVK